MAAHVICFANNKGGVAKTTSAVCIGYAMAQCGRKVLFIDLDSQANLTTLVSDIPTDEHESDILDALVAKDRLPIEKIEDNIYLVPSGLSLATFDTATAADNMRIYTLQDLIAKEADNFDYIIIDCPPALGTITYLALVAAQHLVLVTMPDSMSYSGMMMVGKIMKEVQTNPRLNPSLELTGILITKYRSSKVANTYVKLIEKESGPVFLSPVIHEEAAVQKAVVSHQNLFAYAPDSKTAKAYLSIAKDLIARIEVR